MAERCPTCGQPLPDQAMIRTAEQLIAAMRIAPPSHRGATRDVYEGYHNGKTPTGKFYLTFGGEAVARSAVDEAVRRGLIVPTWPDGGPGSWSLPEQAEENRRLWIAKGMRHGV